jgi:hypothetical protein
VAVAVADSCPFVSVSVSETVRVWIIRSCESSRARRLGLVLSLDGCYPGSPPLFRFPTMTPDEFRTLALGLPEAFEHEHMNHPDFRVRGKIFATLWPDDGWGMVKLTPEQQAEFVADAPTTFAPVPGGWGARGATEVLLAKAKRALVQRALWTAWRNTAPKKLLAAHEERSRG